LHHLPAVASKGFEKGYVLLSGAVGDDNWVDVDASLQHSLHHQHTCCFVVFEHYKNARHSFPCDYVVEESVANVLNVETLTVQVRQLFHF
jgi:hypothetical protein